MSPGDELYPYVQQNIRGQSIGIQQQFMRIAQPGLTPMQGMALRRTIRRRR